MPVLDTINRIRMGIICHLINLINSHRRIWQDIVCMDHRMGRYHRLHMDMPLTEHLVW